MNLNGVKKFFLFLGTILILPIGIGVLIGGGYILFLLLNGSSFDDSIKEVVYLNQMIQPYMKYLMILFIIPLLLKAIKRLKNQEG
ncbi:hypothetical protein [Metabacillus sp. SLBN-84]